MTLFEKISGMFGGRGAYTGANDTRFRNRYAMDRSTPVTEDHALGSWDRNRLRLEARDLWRNNEIVRGAVDRFIDYAVWKGIKPQAQTNDAEWNATSESWWNEIYTPTCDVRQLQGVNLITHQRLTVSARMLDGENAFILLKNGQFQPVEAELICTPQKFHNDKTILQGIRRGKGGIITGYFICPRGRGGAVDKSKSQFVPRENMIHCYKPGRVDQLRGIPEIAPAIDKIRDYDETDEAVVNKVKLDSYQQFKRVRSTGLPNERARGGYQKTDPDNENPQKVEKHEWGRVHNLIENEDLQAFDSLTPNREYVKYMKHELQAIASALNISYEILMLIFTEGSFSSQRAALIHNRHTFLQWHDWLVNCFLQRLWNWRIAKAMKAGELPQAPLDDNGRSQWFRVTWSLPDFDWVDPAKQAQADKERYNLGITSLKRLNMNKGQERDDVFAEKADDIRKAIELAEEINKESTDAGVSWRDIIGSAAKPGAMR